MEPSKIALVTLVEIKYHLSRTLGRMLLTLLILSLEIDDSPRATTPDVHYPTNGTQWRRPGTLEDKLSAPFTVFITSTAAAVFCSLRPPAAPLNSSF